MSRTSPRSQVVLEMVGYLINQIRDMAPTMVMSDPIDRAVREEMMRLFGELYMAQTRLEWLLETAKATPLKTDEGTEVTTEHN